MVKKKLRKMFRKSCASMYAARLMYKNSIKVDLFKVYYM